MEQVFFNELLAYLLKKKLVHREQNHFDSIDLPHLYSLIKPEQKTIEVHHSNLI